MTNPVEEVQATEQVVSQENEKGAQDVEQVQEDNRVITIQSIDHFAFIIDRWHQSKVSVLQHMMNVPVGTPVEVEGETIVMDGEILQGFKLGLTVALAELGVLPFTAVNAPESEAPATPETAPAPNES